MPALLVSLWLLHNARVSAQPAETLELVWTAPQGCPGADDVRARVRKLVGASALSGALRAEATIVRGNDDEFHLRLMVRADNLTGERSIDGKSCDDLAGAAAIALALLLRSGEPLSQEDLAGRSTDGDATANGGQATGTRMTDEDGVGGPRAAPVVPADSRPASARSDGRTTRRFRGLLQLPLLALAFGPLRKPSFGIAVAAGAAFGAWQLLAEGKAWLPQRVDTVHEGERYSADIQRFGGGLRGCRAFTWSRFQLAPCVLISVEHASARGSGPYIVSSEEKSTWAALGVGTQGRVNLATWCNLVAGIDLQFQTSRPKIAIEGVGMVTQLLPVAVAVTLGSEWIL